MQTVKKPICRGPVLAALVLWGSAALAEHYTLPLFVTSTTTDAATGVVRILNGTAESGSVEIYAIDDTGMRSGPATFTLNASAAAEFSASDLVSGNAMKGLTGGIGTLSGNVRLEIDTDLHVVPAAYVRAADGTLSTMHDTVRANAASGGGYEYEVPIFNPSTETTHASSLRLINPGDAAAAVTIAGSDDNGAAASGGTVQLTLAGGAATTLSAQQLEAGDTSLTGRLGAGTGKWRLSVSSDRRIQVVNVVSTTTGHMNNLSTTAVTGSAPVDQEAFTERFMDDGIEFQTDSADSTLALETGDGFTETGEVDGATVSDTGAYAYATIGPNAGQLTLSYDDGDECEANLYFTSRTSGWFAERCTGTDDPDGSWMAGTWSIPDDDDGGSDPVTTTYGVNDALPGVPTSGLFAPSALVGVRSFLASADGTTIGLNDGGYFELDDGTRYTCASSGGCTIVDGTVTQGSVTGTGASQGEVDTFPTFRNATAPVNRTYTVGTAIDTLTLPEASGGNGTLTYSLSPSVPGLSFNAAPRQLTGTPTTAGSYAMTYTATDADGDTDTRNFTITVSDDTPEEGSLGVCQVGMLVRIGQSCTYPGTADAFSVNTRGRGSFLNSLAGIRIRINNETIDGRVYDFAASHQGDGVWRIDRIAGSTQATTTGGVMGDMDDDNDGVPNEDDAFPQDPGESTDTDGDGIGNNADTDDDNDGVSDADDACPLDDDPACGQVSEPDLVVQGASASNAGPEPGETFTFRATVRNQGVGPASATTLRYYRSDDSSISTADSEVGADPVGALAGSAASDYSIALTALTNPGNYYYGACVDSVASETDTANNCSNAVSVTVMSGPGGVPSVESFDLNRGRFNARDLTFTNSRFYVVDNSDDKIYAYSGTGERDPAFDFELHSDNADPEDIEYVDQRFYVVDDSDGHLYAYSPSGERDRAAEFDLDTQNDRPVNSIAYEDRRFYVIHNYGQHDSSNKRVHVYSVSGERDRAAEFDLDASNEHPASIVSVGGFLFILDYWDDKVYTYLTTGQRAPAGDFSLTGNDENAITYAPGRFYVIDMEGDRVRSYSNVGPRSDLVVQSPSVSNDTPAAGESFVFTATVRNQGNAAAAATTVRYYRSDDRTISTQDTQVGMGAVSGLPAAGTSDVSISLTMPSTSGTYYYGACIDPVPDESRTRNNCSSAVTVATPRPDLVVRSPSVSNDTPAVGESFVFVATVRNQGNAAATATTVRYYRSDNRTISNKDTPVGTSAVGALPIDGTSSATITLPAPTAERTYYYGACVDQVLDESQTGNNCSSGVPVFGGGPFPSYDLDISSIRLHGRFLFLAGDPLEMTVGVTNRGPNASRPAKLRFSGGDSFDLDIPVLNPNETKTYANQKVDTVNSPGTYRIRACIVEAPGEEITSNNCETRSITIR